MLRHARRRTLLIVGILALLAFHGIAADRLGEHWLRPATLLVTATFMGAITAALLYYVLDWHPITVDKVFGAVAAYVLIAFACVFGLLQQVQPGAFHAAPVHAPNNQLDWSAMMYFSFTVLTSTGFGEITPVTRMARAVIVIEQVLGVMYVAFLIARLANLYGTGGIAGIDGRALPHGSVERKRSSFSKPGANRSCPSTRCDGVLLSLGDCTRSTASTRLPLRASSIAKGAPSQRAPMTITAQFGTREIMLSSRPRASSALSTRSEQKP